MEPELINFDSHIPYYAQLIDLIKNQIQQQVWKPGDKIPGEPELCELYGISRTVVRQALQELEHDGLILRRKGKGTFVASPKIGESLAYKLTGFYHDMLERGLRPATRVLHQRVISVPETAAAYLELTAGTPVVDIRRLRSVNDEPIQLVTSFIPYSLCPQAAEVDLTDRSLYDFLEECGLRITRGRRFIEAVEAGDEAARLLKVKRGQAMVMLNSVSYLANGVPVEYYLAIHRGDRTRFEVQLVRSAEPVGTMLD
jgi:GntR family transcriptional regulator